MKQDPGKLDFLAISQIILATYKRLEFMKWWRWSKCHDGMWDDLQ